MKVEHLLAFAAVTQGPEEAIKDLCCHFIDMHFEHIGCSECDKRTAEAAEKFGEGIAAGFEMKLVIKNQGTEQMTIDFEVIGAGSPLLMTALFLNWIQAARENLGESLAAALAEPDSTGTVH